MSNLAIFKIGVGPSSSHTLGPLTAGNIFCKKIAPKLADIKRVKITLYGSLSLTGKGHLTDRAVIWGLNALNAKELNSDLQERVWDEANSGKLNLCGKKEISFDMQNDLIFSNEFLPLHENALKIEAFNSGGELLDSEVYYSTGGGFIKTADELKSASSVATAPTNQKLHCDFAAPILQICEQNGWSLAEYSLNYELQFLAKREIEEYLSLIWEVMQEAYFAGIHPKNSVLPGPLKLKRRAPGLFERLQMSADPLAILDFISLYAIAVAEENASGARVVTAPTNGACAVVPAVMLYLKNHSVGFNEVKAREFLLTAALIGALYKKNASISGAEAGCQAEIGVASSMAAAAMATVLGASAKSSANAAEAAMEHHLGLTCDPVGGLVQIPCIERNAFGAMKAILAARMAMARHSTPRVGLDDIIKTMYQTGHDMPRGYKETAEAGLAKFIVC